ncbi:MAG: hypothetical protein ACTSR0_07455 [Candidatus Asgardarchaeia archaeon]
MGDRSGDRKDDFYYENKIGNSLGFLLFPLCEVFDLGDYVEILIDTRFHTIEKIIFLSNDEISIFYRRRKQRKIFKRSIKIGCKVIVRNSEKEERNGIIILKLPKE